MTVGRTILGSVAVGVFFLTGAATASATTSAAGSASATVTTAQILTSTPTVTPEDDSGWQ